MKHTTHDTLISKQQSYNKTAARLQDNLFLRTEAALTDAELSAAKEVVRATNFVQAVYNGDLDAAVADITDNIDLESGSGRYTNRMRPGIGIYNPKSTDIEFTVKDSVVSVKDINAWNSYSTADLISEILGSPVQNASVDKLNADLAAANESHTQDEATALIESGNYGMEVGDYMGSGSIGPYGSGEFCGDDGFDYIETDKGTLIRIGRGYGSIDGEDWNLYSKDGLDSVVMTLSEPPSEQAGEILMGHAANGNSSDLETAADEITMLVQLAQLLENPDDEPSEFFAEHIMNADRKYREEQGQQNLFPTPENA